MRWLRECFVLLHVFQPFQFIHCNGERCQMSCHLRKKQMKVLPITLAIIFTILSCYQAKNLPIIFMHGIGGAATDFRYMVQWAAKAGYATFSLDVDPRSDSMFTPMDIQLQHLASAIEETKKNNGFTDHHLICHSQGGLMCRTYLQSHAHTVHTFVSLSGVQFGEYGLPEGVKKYVPVLQNITRDEAYLVLYTKFAQATLSFANYWKDPFHYPLYQSSVSYLTLYNNESAVVDPRVSSFRSNFLRLKKAVFTASPQDNVIEPYFSALFSFWDVNEKTPTFRRVPMEDQPIYKTDLIGLKTMKQDGRLHMFDVPNVYHTHWLSDESLFNKYVLPYLN